MRVMMAGSHAHSPKIPAVARGPTEAHLKRPRTLTFFHFTREMRDMIYDYVLSRPVMQLISSSNTDVLHTSVRRSTPATTR